MMTTQSPVAASFAVHTASPHDLNALMQGHLIRVFNERRHDRRMNALKELYTEDATLFEPHATATGYDAIARAVENLQASLPSSFVFTAVGAAVAHNGLACLHWRAGPPDSPAAATGTDVARVENGRVKILHVFVDQEPR